MKNIRFDNYHKQVKDILGHMVVNNQKVSDISMRLENYCNAARHNQFVTVHNAQEYEFSFKYGVKRALGFTDAEFTAKNLIGQTDRHRKISPIIHPDDICWYLHYGVLLYKLLSNAASSLNFDTDYAWFRFRIRNSKGQLLMAEYITLLHEVTSEGQLLSHLDVWTVLPLNNSDTFTPDFGFYTKKNFEKNATLFNKINEEQLGIRFTNREKEVAKKLMLGLTRKEVAGELAIGVGSVNTHVNNMKEKVNLYQSQIAPLKPISNITELLRFANAYKLLH